METEQWTRERVMMEWFWKPLQNVECAPFEECVLQPVVEGGVRFGVEPRMDARVTLLFDSPGDSDEMGSRISVLEELNERYGHLLDLEQIILALRRFSREEFFSALAEECIHGGLGVYWSKTRFCVFSLSRGPRALFARLCIQGLEDSQRKLRDALGVVLAESPSLSGGAQAAVKAALGAA